MNGQGGERGEALATFAGGCFWCMVKPFKELPGVMKIAAGYTGGRTPNPTYEEVCRHHTGHREAVQVTFDPAVTSYRELLDVFWRQIDPTDPAGQFADRGASYRTAIFYHGEDQRRQAEASKQALEASGRFGGPVVTEILPATNFYPAEEYHQDYHAKNPAHYQAYRRGSGRQAFLELHWPAEGGAKKGDGNPPRELTSLQRAVTRENATEPPFQNEYWDNWREGLYVDVISGAPLFSSKDKFESGCGWPSFSRPLEENVVRERTDRSHGMVRTEVRSADSDAHLGHVFDDGPRETGGRRYCINSAALRFVPKDELEREGYGEHRSLFD